MPYTRLFYHFIWATKNRLPLISDKNHDAIQGTIATKVADLGGIVYALNSMPNHLHLVANVPVTMAVAAFVGQLKGSSSHAARQVATDADEPFAWQAEYGALSISESHLPAVVRYVQQQQQHHARPELNEKLEIFEG